MSLPASTCHIKFLGVSTTMRVAAGDIMETKYATHEFYELDILKEIRARNLAGVYIDVGANIGNHTVFFSKHCRSTRVIAVEPNPAALELLAQNCKQLDRVTIAPFAAGAQQKTVRVGPTAATNLGSSRIGKAGVAASMDTLDRIAGDPVAAVIKIDTEGYEIEVLRGARRLLKSRPLLAIECSTPVSLEAVSRELEQYGRYSVSPRYCATPTYLFSPE